MKIGLLLIGGSMKGVAGHGGVVAALRELDIKPDVILGASAGSVVGTFQAIGMSTEEMYKRIISLETRDFLDPFSRLYLLYELINNRAKNFTGFVKGDKVTEYMEKVLKEKDDFSKVEIPLYIAATNLISHKVVLFNTGAISEKIRASISIPMLFCPKKIEGKTYIDGALAKEILPEVFLEVQPDLDLIIVSNLSYENQVTEQEMLDNSPLPIFEIVRSVLSVHQRRNWPPRLGKTRIIYLKPGIRTVVDIFHPDPEKAKSIFEESKRFTIHHLSRTIKLIKKKG